MKSIFRKRRREETSDDDSSDDSSDEDSAVQRHAVVRKAEVADTPSDVLPPKFNRHHHILLIHSVYMPLTLFTNRNLQHINKDGPFLATTKINAWDKGKIKSVKALDIAKFEALHGTEENLSHAQWTEAARNYVNFYKSLEDERQLRSSRWDAHFGFFKAREDFFKNFKTILLLDIQMRKDYIAQSFTFSAQYYAFELQQKIWDDDMESLKEMIMQSRFNNRGSRGRSTGKRWRRKKAS